MGKARNSLDPKKPQFSQVELCEVAEIPMATANNWILTGALRPADVGKPQSSQAETVFRSLYTTDALIQDKCSAGVNRLTCGASELQRSGHIHTLASNCHRQGYGGLRGFAMSEPIKSQSISRRRLFWLAAIAAAVAAPATMLSTSDVRAQQSDQAPAAEPTAPKTGEKKKKKTKTKTKTKKKATPGATTAPASSPPTPPKQQ